MKRYHEFNESRNHKKPRRNRGGNLNDMWQQQHGNQQKVVEPRGMNMSFSERFKYILGKMDKKGNKIAKELVRVAKEPDAKFDQSYIDLTGRDDTLSYLPNGARDIPEEERFKSNKRQHAKIYKTIKTLFGSKFTKEEVTKFVSIYKEVYNIGPDSSLEKPKQTNEQIIKKLTIDTKSGKIKWNREVITGGNSTRYDCIIPITEKKRLVFCLFYFGEDAKDQTLSFLTLNLYNDSSPTEEYKRKWIHTFVYKEIGDFLKEFKTSTNAK